MFGWDYDDGRSIQHEKNKSQKKSTLMTPKKNTEILYKLATMARMGRKRAEQREEGKECLIIFFCVFFFQFLLSLALLFPFGGCATVEREERNISEGILQ